MSEEINNESVAASAPEASEAPAVAASADARPERKFQKREGQEGDSYQRMPRFKRKVCRFCFDKEAEMDYKKPKTLERYITDRGKILPRRVSGTCAKHQRLISTEIKKARIIALLPFIEL